MTRMNFRQPYVSIFSFLAPASCYINLPTSRFNNALPFVSVYFTLLLAIQYISNISLRVEEVGTAYFLKRDKFW